MPRLGLVSNDTAVQKNPDGPVDIYFGPKPLAGKASNWVPTGGRSLGLLLRLYDLRKELFENTWQLPDVKQVR